MFAQRIEVNFTSMSVWSEDQSLTTPDIRLQTPTLIGCILLKNYALFAPPAATGKEVRFSQF
jgi:hypothetical protein